MSTSARQSTLRRLTVIVALQWLGATLGLPLLPLFLERHHGTPTLVGLVMASFFVAGLATQFVVGHLADRFGRRRVLATGLAAYGIASAAYLLPVSAGFFALARMVQGAGAGAIEVASLSAVAALFPEAERGRAMSRIFAAQLSGIAIGPLAGAVVTVGQLGWAFLAAGVASSVAAFWALRCDLGESEADPTPLPPMQRTPQIYGAVVAAVASGLCVGVYEACWSLLMHARGASTLDIRLSWTFFCTPWVLLSRAGGWLADHANRKLIAIAGTFSSAVFLATYPHLHSVRVLLGTGSLEAVASALSVPSISSLLSQGATSREMGRRQGLSTSANTAALACAAAGAGALFSVNPVLPFTVFASASIVCTATLWWWWRAVVGAVAGDDDAPATHEGPPARTPLPT